ncbi:MAG TPA: tetratricopeptide repeat protein [Chloroflexota bacterium]
MARALEGTAGGPLTCTPVRMRALQGAGWFAHVQNDSDTASTLLGESLSIARALDDRRGVAWAMHLLGRVRYFEGDPAGAAAFGDEALTIAREIDDQWVVGWCLHLQGRAEHMRGNYARALELYEESLAAREQRGNRDGSCIVLSLMGILAFHQRRYEDARTLYTALWPFSMSSATAGRRQTLWPRSPEWQRPRATLAARPSWAAQRSGGRGRSL